MSRAAGTTEESRELVERFRDGLPGAFEEIVARHRRPLYLVARRMLASHEDADEATQLAFLRAWRARARFRGDAALRTWLTRIVINVARSMRAARVPAGNPEGLEGLPDPARAADESVHRRRLRGRVRAAVRKLPDRQRDVVLLKVFAEMTHREVAEVLRISEGTVKAHLHQAVANLRRRLAIAGAGEEA